AQMTCADKGKLKKKNRQQITKAEAQAEEGQKCARVCRMPNISIGTGVDQLMFGRDRHINRKIATEISDRVPTQDQASEKQQEAEEVKSSRRRHGYAREEPDDLDTRPHTTNDKYRN